MNSEELRTALQAKVEEIKEKDILNRALTVARELGKSNRQTVNDMYVTDYLFEAQAGRTHLKVRKGHSGQFGHLTELRVFVNHRLVIDISQLDFPPKTEVDEARSFQDEGERWFQVDSFESGDWIDLLDVKKIKRRLRDKRRRDRKKREKETELQERTRPLSDDEERIARNLGVKSD